MDNAILAEAVRAEFNRLGLLPAQQAHVSGRMADIIHGP